MSEVPLYTHPRIGVQAGVQRAGSEMEANDIATPRTKCVIVPLSIDVETT